jgi:hypothetical protein
MKGNFHLPAEPQFLAFAFCLRYEIDFLFALEDYCPIGVICAYGRIYPEPKRKLEKELYVRD